MAWLTVWDADTGGQKACADAREIAAMHLAAIPAKIVDLRAIERALAQAVRGCDTGGMAECPVISALSSAATPT